jgi:hypothetical protein
VLAQDEDVPLWGRHPKPTYYSELRALDRKKMIRPRLLRDHGVDLVNVGVMDLVSNREVRVALGKNIIPPSSVRLVRLPTAIEGNAAADTRSTRD